ncbi:Transforming growth factor-beta receptor-associated protein 1 [Hypsizygus marmoreus]|uniref:Transforming growth factor-beta receptor-associated protein 1 n=1 Tax=Hypsizygus marmoreus TaxID=39966 RepID=A0A369K5N9_HYPMA|nr:Transforming growth factor-beta receptor-associated protein 1 [Hypsizygus marmoreus]
MRFIKYKLQTSDTVESTNPDLELLPSADRDADKASFLAATVNVEANAHNLDLYLQHLISPVVDDSGLQTGTIHVRCAQALGSEIYVGCSNGELIRFALQADDPNKLESYSILSRQTVPNGKPVDEIVLIPCLSRAFILSGNLLLDRIVHFYTLPSLDPVAPSLVKPIRHVVTLAVDHRDLQRPPLSSSGPPAPMDPVNFCIIKRSSIAMYTMRERLSYHKEIPLPEGATLARRIGRSLCIADKENYNMVDLEGASLFPVIPISQAPESSTAFVKPSITIVGENEFLILSWTGASTIGLFVTGDGDPVRGTLEWPMHPEAVCLDYPYVTTLLPNDTIEVHSIETQSIVQVISAPASSSPSTPTTEENSNPRSRLKLVSSLGGYLVPSTQRSDKMRTVPVRLLRGSEAIPSTT